MKHTRSRFLAGTMILVASVFAFPAWVRAQTSWSSATDGEWGDTAKWTDGVPDGNQANLQRTDGSYTVWVTNGVESAFSRLHMGNNTSGANTTRLHIAQGELRQAGGGGVIESSSGVEVFIGDGGVLSHAGTNDVQTQYLDIKNGSTWTIDGGSLLVTNLLASGSGRGQAWIGQASSAGLYLKSGVVDFRHGSGTMARELYVGRQNPGHTGVVEVTGGTMYLSTPASRGSVLQIARWAGSHGSVRLLGGEMVLDGSTRTLVGGNDDNSDHAGAYGELIIGTNGIYSGFVDGEGNRIGVGHGNNGSGYMYSEGIVHAGAFVIGYKTDGRRAGTATGRVVIAGGSVTSEARIDLGYGEPNYGTEPTTGYGTLELQSGTLTTHRRAITVGRGHDNAVGIGVMKMSGGVLSQEGAWQENANDLQGFNFGTIRADSTGADTRALGRLELSGGVISNATAFVLGGNGGTGIVHQTAGTFSNGSAPDSQPVVIGYNWGASAPPAGNGHGEYHIEDGTFETAFDVYVGGLVGVEYGSSGGNLVNQPGATGRLQVDGGLFSVGRKLHVGGNGTGEISMGSAGSLTVGNAILDSGATLEFVFGDAGVGLFTVEGELDIDADAQLVIDLTGFNPTEVSRFKVASYDSRTAGFDAANISVVGGTAVVDQRANEIWVSIPEGTSLIVR